MTASLKADKWAKMVLLNLHVFKDGLLSLLGAEQPSALMDFIDKLGLIVQASPLEPPPSPGGALARTGLHTHVY